MIFYPEDLNSIFYSSFFLDLFLIGLSLTMEIIKANVLDSRLKAQIPLTEPP